MLRKDTFRFMRDGTHVKILILKGIIFISAVIFIVPLIFTIAYSFIIDNTFSFSGYKELLFDCFIFYRMFWNSMMYAGIIMLCQIFIIILAAFSFHFARFKGKKILFLFYVVLMMMPLQVVILPNYIGLRDMGLLNTRLGIILPMIFSPFGVVVLYQYIRGIDVYSVEAARLETNSIFKILIHIVVPQLKVCIYAVALFIFSECFNMVEQPMLFLNDEKLKTLTTFISQSDNYNNNVLFPASVIFIIPVFLFYIFFHDELEKGLRFL